MYTLHEVICPVLFMSKGVFTHTHSTCLCARHKCMESHVETFMVPFNGNFEKISAQLPVELVTELSQITKDM